MRIKGVDYKLYWSLGGFFVYEEIAGEPFQAGRSVSMYMLLYAFLIYCNRKQETKFNMEFDEFVDACSEDPSIFQQFIDMMNEHGRLESITGDEDKKKA